MDSLDKQRYYYLGHVLYAKCVRGEKVEDDELLQRIAIKHFPVTLQEMKDLCGLELDTVQEKRYKALTKDSLETLQHLQASDLISEDIANYVLIDYMNNYDHIYREQKKLMIRLTNYINSITRTNYQFTLGRIDHLDLELLYEYIQDFTIKYWTNYYGILTSDKREIRENLEAIAYDLRDHYNLDYDIEIDDDDMPLSDDEESTLDTYKDYFDKAVGYQLYHESGINPSDDDIIDALTSFIDFEPEDEDSRSPDVVLYDSETVDNIKIELLEYCHERFEEIKEEMKESELESEGESEGESELESELESEGESEQEPESESENEQETEREKLYKSIEDEYNRNLGEKYGMTEEEILQEYYKDMESQDELIREMEKQHF